MVRNRLIVVIVSMVILLSGCTTQEVVIKEVVKEIDNPVYITVYGTKFHKENCEYLRGSKLVTKREDAEGAGFKPCSVCNP